MHVQRPEEGIGCLALLSFSFLLWSQDLLLNQELGSVRATLCELVVSGHHGIVSIFWCHSCIRIYNEAMHRDGFFKERLGWLKD